jgi:hypothetical protein
MNVALLSLSPMGLRSTSGSDSSMVCVKPTYEAGSYAGRDEPQEGEMHADMSFCHEIMT